MRFNGNLLEGCEGCGARAVGEPLARPEHLLPSYGRALFVAALGMLLLLIFLGSTIAALFEQSSFKLEFWSTVAAAETAAWRLKWVLAPASVLALWLCVRICGTMERQRERFIGLSFAHGGTASAALVIMMIALFIGITVPERIRQRQRGIDAGFYAQGYTLNRALLEYRRLYGTLPTDIEDIRRKVPDSDGSIAAALNGLDSAGYRTWSLQARLPDKKSKTLRGAVIRPVSTNSTTDDALDEGLAFTNYEMRLPGEDKVLGTDDDWKVRDGVIFKPTPSGQADLSSPHSDLP
ncbi:MAG TPA: hypothetical protein VGB17_11555 [Pyrinomonadaceae bacterium]